MTATHPLSSPIARGQRLRYIRKELLNLSRSAFERRHADLKITEARLQNWEEARFKGLKEQHVDQLLEAFTREQILCEKYWLLEGVGQPPRRQEALDQVREAPSGVYQLQEETAIAQELQLFHQGHVGVIDAIVSDDGLAPWCCPGDYVAGARYTGSAIQQAVGTCCIIQTSDGQVLLRKLTFNADNSYSLLCTNPNTRITERVLHHVKLFSAAPIVWWRRPIYPPP